MEKCDYIVSNTIAINSMIGNIIRHDLFHLQGKYKYLYPNISFFEVFSQIGAVPESTAYSKIEM